jgi:hypothetical protein
MVKRHTFDPAAIDLDGVPCPSVREACPKAVPSRGGHFALMPKRVAIVPKPLAMEGEPLALRSQPLALRSQTLGDPGMACRHEQKLRSDGDNLRGDGERARRRGPQTLALPSNRLGKRDSASRHHDLRLHHRSRPVTHSQEVHHDLADVPAYLHPDHDDESW